MPFGVNPRLTNLGIESGTPTGQQGAEQPFKPNSRLMDLMRQSVDVTSQLDSARQMEPKGLLDRLKSPGGIATAGIGVLASVLGAPEAGLPLLQGLLQGSAQAAQEEKAGLLANIEQLQKQLQDQQQTTSAMLQDQPGLFLTASGENLVDPEFLGLLSGLPISISPASKGKIQSRSETQKRSISVWTNLLKQAETPNQKFAAAQGLSEAADLDMTEAQLATFLEATDEASLINMFLDSADVNTVLSAALAAQTNDASILDPPYLAMIAGKPKTPSSYSDEKNRMTLQYWKQFEEWRKTPQGMLVSEETPIIQLEAWGAEPDNGAGLLFLTSTLIKDPKGEAITGTRALLMAMKAEEGFRRLQAMQEGAILDPEEMREHSVQAINDMDSYGKEALAANSAKLLTIGMRKISAALEATGRDPSELQEMWRQVMVEAGTLQLATIPEDDFNKAITTVMQRILKAGE